LELSLVGLKIKSRKEELSVIDTILPSFGGTMLCKKCSYSAWSNKKRSMISLDLVDEIGHNFDILLNF